MLRREENRKRRMKRRRRRRRRTDGQMDLNPIYSYLIASTGFKSAALMD